MIIVFFLVTAVANIVAALDPLESLLRSGTIPYFLNEKRCHLLLANGDNAGKILRCDNVTISYLNDNYLNNSRLLNDLYLSELLLEDMGNEFNIVPNLALGLESGIEIFKLVRSNVSDEQLNYLFNEQRKYTNLRSLDLSTNLISRPRSSQLNKHMERLKILRLSRNKVEYLPINLFNHVSQSLNELYLNGNTLKSIVGQEEAGGNKTIRSTEDSVDSQLLLFTKLNNLFVLDLSQNMLNDLPRNVFTGLAKLKQLNLSENNLAIVPFQVFKDLQEIKMLDLSFNFMRSVLENFFITNKKLKVLKLNNNEIDKISMNSFYGLRQLTDLDLSMNRLIFIDRNAFDDLQELRTLNLRNNQMVQFSTTLFNSLTQLEVLDLSENYYRSLPSGLFTKQLECLKELYIENNKYLEILNNNFVSRNKETGGKKLRALQKLIVRNNPEMGTIEKIVFETTPNLEVLDLSGNKLAEVPKLIGSLQHLQILRVENNQLTFLPEDVKHLERLKYVNMQNNNYACDCRMYWMTKWLDKVVMNWQNQTAVKAINKTANMNQEGTIYISDSKGLEFLDQFIHYKKLKCRHAYPGDMIRVLRQLHCVEPKLVDKSESKMHLLKSDAILECSFTGNPQPNIIWVTPQSHILRYHPDPDVKPILMLDNKYEQKIEFQTLTANVVEDIIEETNKQQQNPQQLLLGGSARENRTIVDLGNAVGLEMRKEPGVTLLENGYLKVHNVSRKDSGVYTCYAWNILGNTSQEIR